MGLCNQIADKVLATVVNRGDYPSHGSFGKHNSGGLAYLIFAELKHDNLTIKECEKLSAQQLLTWLKAERMMKVSEQ